MAVTLVNSPATPIAAYGNIVFELSIDDIGDGTTEIRKLAYQLKTAGGAEITPIEAVRPPVAGTPIFIDIAKDVQGLVKTLVPTVPDGYSAINAEDMYIEVVLHFGEIITNLEDCTTETVIANESEPITVFNTALQAYEKPLDSSSKRFLVHQPAITWGNRDAVNYLASMGSIAGTVTTSSGASVPSAAPYDANIIAFGIHGYDFPDEATIRWIKYTGEGKSFQINFRDSCERGSSFANIMFLDPLGGRNCMSFEVITSMSMTSSFETVKRANPYTFSGGSGSLNSREVMGGDTIVNKVSRERITLLRDAPDKDDHRDWYNAFLGSSGYHIQRTDSDGNLTWQKFILEAGSIQYRGEDTIDLQVSGYCVPLYNSQRMDV